MNKIGNSNLTSIRSAYLKARSENNATEMTKLKQEAMKIMAEENVENSVEISTEKEKNIKNIDGDILEIQKKS